MYLDVKKLSKLYLVKTLSKVLGVSRSVYYPYHPSISHRRSDSDTSLAKRVQEVFSDHNRRYSTSCIHAELKYQGEGGTI